jgi:hypothetical protein
MHIISNNPAKVSLLALCLVVVVATSAAETKSGPNVTPILNPEKQGTELAARLRSAVPAEPSVSGKLEITTRDDTTTVIPIVSRVVSSLTNVQVIYRAETTPGHPAEELTITHTTNAPNRYTLAVATNLSAALLDSRQLTRPFAGSDFSVFDLGLEFLHWPQQRVLRHEMGRSRSCWVLESITPSAVPGGYARVVSWVDVEYEGILQAEAYEKVGDRDPIKKFSVGPLRKVGGERKIESLKMHNSRTRRDTELKFDLQGKL